MDRRLVGDGASLNAVVKRKIHSPRRESNPRTLIVQPLASRYTDRVRWGKVIEGPLRAYGPYIHCSLLYRSVHNFVFHFLLIYRT
jgi:hypothetical protein